MGASQSDTLIPLVTLGSNPILLYFESYNCPSVSNETNKKQAPANAGACSSEYLFEFFKILLGGILIIVRHIRFYSGDDDVQPPLGP